jgi:acetyl-CoA carboxylase biotin carboxylase subunit
MFRKVLIANRGEIAVRITRTLREMGVTPVAVYSDADRAAPHVRMADEAARIGTAPSSDSYLQIDRIVDAALAHDAEAIHPGYGFLSENAEFAAACERAGIVFIGPSAESIRKMGSKTAARELAAKAGVPVVPGTRHGLRDWEEVSGYAREFGFPIMLKAVAGGGGKGMRRVDREDQLESSFRDASSEAERAFGDGAVYLEKLIEAPRHIEIQVLGDLHGHMVHLGERECSIQRRNQKLVEECPSPLVVQYPDLRERMGEAAIRAARAAGYHNAGTVEFLVDDRRNFYFLEMNTRLQVEHPVTEWVTGLDLVRLQLEIAAGEKLTLEQEQIRWRGSAIECRIYAEDPENQFFPSAGRITRLDTPSGPGVRVDSGVYPGWTVPLEYDPLIAKLSVWSPAREESRVRLLRALNEYRVAGIQTNIDFFREIVNDDQFRRAKLDTGFIERFMARRKPDEPNDPELETIAALVAHALLSEAGAGAETPSARSCTPTISQWRTEGRDSLLR